MLFSVLSVVGFRMSFGFVFVASLQESLKQFPSLEFKLCLLLLSSLMLLCLLFFNVSKPFESVSFGLSWVCVKPGPFTFFKSWHLQHGEAAPAAPGANAAAQEA